MDTSETNKLKKMESYCLKNAIQNEVALEKQISTLKRGKSVFKNLLFQLLPPRRRRRSIRIIKLATSAETHNFKLVFCQISSRPVISNMKIPEVDLLSLTKKYSLVGVWKVLNAFCKLTKNTKNQTANSPSLKPNS